MLPLRVLVVGVFASLILAPSLVLAQRSGGMDSGMQGGMSGATSGGAPGGMSGMPGGVRLWPGGGGSVTKGGMSGSMPGVPSGVRGTMPGTMPGTAPGGMIGGAMQGPTPPGAMRSRGPGVSGTLPGSKGGGMSGRTADPLRGGPAGSAMPDPSKTMERDELSRPAPGVGTEKSRRDRM